MELYSPERVVGMAKQMGMPGGWSLDLTTVDDLGNPWDFTQVAMRNKPFRLLKEQTPSIVIGSPPCTEMSQFTNLNFPRMDPQEVARRRKLAAAHVRFCLYLYKKQLRAGRYFLLEHPHGATSWKMSEVVDLAKDDGVLKIR